MAAQTNAGKLSKTKNIGKFFRHAKAELKKVIWPTKKDLTSYTIIVLVTCTLVAIATWVLDTVFGKALQLIIK